MSTTTPRSSSPRTAGKNGLVLIAVLIGAVVAGFGLGFLAISMTSGGTSTRPPAADATPTAAGPSTTTPAASVSPSLTASPAPAATGSPPASQGPTVAPTAGTPPLPAMLAAIGDSYSQAYSVSPTYLRDHPEFSWVVGTAKNDGVTSLLERFRALGAAPVVVDAATSGKKMIDAQRQAEQVIEAAQAVDRSKTAYVTFALGVNDLCDDPKTPIADFTAQLQAAVETLQAGLPSGSRLLMEPLPDFRHLRDITQANPAARAALLEFKNSSRCAPFLGSNSPTSIPDAEAILAAYNAAIEAQCNQVNAATGPSATLRCTYDEALLSDRDFVIGDLSTVDYFHPSLSGQAKMAAAAWKADAWPNGVAGSPGPLLGRLVPLPAGGLASAAWAPSALTEPQRAAGTGRLR
jgi:lysophospholipase L1-like esterase